MTKTIGVFEGWQRGALPLPSLFLPLLKENRKLVEAETHYAVHTQYNNILYILHTIYCCYSCSRGCTCPLHTIAIYSVVASPLCPSKHFLLDTLMQKHFYDGIFSKLCTTIKHFRLCFRLWFWTLHHKNILFKPTKQSYNPLYKRIDHC